MPIPFRLNRSAGRIVCLLALFLCLARPVFTQPMAEPQREQLLNGLDILLWPKPGSSKVLIKLRIHSGAAFDLAGKAGEMALLGDILFPDAATIDYFTDEMDGRLEVHVDYDSMTITIEGNASEFDKIIEVLRNALLSTQLSPEVVDRIRQSRIKILRETAVSPSITADRAIASRLFDDFPYGRPAAGSPEEVARVDRADLMLARDRFLNSNNATLAIAGGVPPSRVLRTLRQLLGPWRKSEQVVPTTFRHPQPPDQRTLIINVPMQTAELRLAVRGLSRADADAVAAAVLARIAHQRWIELLPALARKPTFARSETHVLQGIFTLGTSIEESNVADALAAAKKTLESLQTTPPAPAELERAKNELIAENANAASRPGASVDPWLDQRTYKLKTLPDLTALTMAVTANDVQRVGGRLFKETPQVSVVIGDPLHLKAVLEGRFPYQVLGAVEATTQPAKPPAKPAGTPSPR